jgi:hypothetical protein
VGSIRHNELGLRSQGQSNDHSLTHATRKLMRVMVNSLSSGRNAGVLQQANGALTGFFV